MSRLKQSFKAILIDKTGMKLQDSICVEVINSKGQVKKKT